MFRNHRKVSLNIASEASYGYGDKSLLTMSNSVTRQVTFNRTKVVENAIIKNVTFGVIFKQCAEPYLNYTFEEVIQIPKDF